VSALTVQPAAAVHGRISGPPAGLC